MNLNKKIGRERFDVEHTRRADRFFVDLRIPLIICVAEAILILMLCIATYNSYDGGDSAFPPEQIFSFLFLFYVISAGIVCAVYLVKYFRAKRAEEEARRINTEIYDMFRFVIDTPYTVVDESGKVRDISGALLDILGYKKSVSGMDFSELCQISVKALAARAKNREAYLSEPIYDLPEEAPLPDLPIVKLADGKKYEIHSYVMRAKEKNYYFAVFKDVEELINLREKIEREESVVAYIMLDNLQELTQYVRADYRIASNEIENILTDWTRSMHGFIRQYDKDRYIVMISREELDRQMNDDFSIQEKIMGLRIGDNSFPVTVSMGISSIDGSFEEKEKAAMAALDVVIQRGGNQVAVKREGASGYVFFGGTHKTMENNTSVVSRVSAEILEKKIQNCSNILIMGHADPDFDSIGASVGLARLCTSIINDVFRNSPDILRPEVNIVINKNCDSFNTCYRQLEPLGIYDNIFIEKEAASERVTPDTILIIADVNNTYIYEAPDLAKTIDSIAVIDHHRLSSPLPFTPFLQYVEATRSSASEIVSEMLQQSKYDISLHKEEAEVLLSGIMLDTNNFTRNAGSRTFAIVHYLYTRGAHTEVVREFFNEPLEDILLTDKFESSAVIYRDSVAIALMTEDMRDSTPTELKVLASKVANKLLGAQGVEASFALVPMGEDVSLSGRSKGKINVQLIAERLRGGGHFDMAGALIKNSSIEAAEEILREAIDDYFEYDYKNLDK